MIALNYYSLLNQLNDWHLTKKELEVIAFTCVKGNISSGGNKKQFIEQFKSSKPSLTNFIWKLSKLGYLVKEKDRRITLHPSLVLSFEDNIVVQLTLINEAGRTNRKDS